MNATSPDPPPGSLFQRIPLSPVPAEGMILPPEDKLPPIVNRSVEGL